MKKPILLKSTVLERPPVLLRLVFSLLLVGLISSFAMAQSVVKGRISDETGTGMPGVNVIIKGTTVGATTDAEGQYTIDVPAGSEDAVLVVSFIGYVTEEQAIGGRTVIDVNLTPSIETLNEIVVVGYGTQKKSDVTGAITSVKAEELREVPAANLQQALQGRAAGVEIQRVGTAPGSSARIRIRGDRSINGSNDPLIVLDGIPYDGSLNDINQDDIASIDVLKDASATAIYGSRGANGVVIITTKRGVAGETRLTLDSYYGVTTVARKYDMMNAEEYAAMRDEAGFAGGYQAEEVESIATGRSTDWQDLMYKDGYITNHNLRASGGNDKSQYSLSGGYFKETTILPGQDFARYSVKATVDTQVGKKLKMGLNTMNTLNISNGTLFVNPQADAPGGLGGGIMYNILATSPLMPAYEPNGDIFKEPFGNQDDRSANYSPLFLKNNTNDWVDKVRRLRTFNSLYAEYQIVEGLKYRFNLGLDYNQQNYAQFRGTDTYFRKAGANMARVRNAEQYSWTAENVLTYDKTFAEKHRLTFTGLYSAQQSRSFYTQVHKDQITADFIEFYNMGLASADASVPPVVEGGEQSWGILSYMARVNYAFDDRYLLTLTYRRDGSSRLAEKWHQYPAVALGWNLMNESFLQDVSAITNLKIRAGYGQTSNQSVDPYTTLGGVNNSYQNVPIRYNYGTQQVSGYLPTRIPDKTLDWEYTNTINIGLDYGILNNRVTGTIEWYKAKTSNLLWDRSMPITSGYPDAFQTNLGTMENHGLEVSLSTVNVKSASGFTWNTDVNWFFNRNKLTEFAPGVKRNIAAGLHVGEPITAIYDYKKLGIWQLDEADQAATFGQLPGQLKLADLNSPGEGGEGVPDGLITEDDRTIIGNQQAKWQAGMTNRFSYKGIDLSIVAFARYGGLLMSYLHAPNGAYLTNLNGNRNSLDVDYWTPTNPTNEFPQPASAIPAGATNSWSTLGYYDATFVKIRSINLGYTLPSSLVSRIKAKSLRVYVTAQNPFLLFCPYVTKHNGVDPEPTGQGTTGAVATAGNFRTTGKNQGLIISASTPPTRSFIFGVNISF